MTGVTKARQIGLGIIGSGRIGTLRARLAAGHSAVGSIAVSDLDPANADKLAGLVGGRSHGDDNLAVIDDPDVTAVIVSTAEGEHMAPMLAALERNKDPQPQMAAGSHQTSERGLARPHDPLAINKISYLRR
jgi:hypothetical protein